jgi:sugar phosphate isomerase/epimerase
MHLRSPPLEQSDHAAGGGLDDGLHIAVRQRMRERLASGLHTALFTGPMKLAFHTCGLEHMPFAAALERLADIGYEGCGPIVGPGCHLDPDGLTDSQKADYRAQAADLGLAFSTLNPWKMGSLVAGVASGETETFFRKALDLAAEMGAPGVKFLPGGWKEGENAGWRLMVPVVRRICYHAEQVGVDLLMHNHENQLLDTANLFALLRRHVGSERLRINLDCGNLAILMDDPSRAVQDHADQVAYVRVKGMQGYYPFYQQCPPGEPGDIVDWEGVVAALGRVGYEGWLELVTYPWFPPDFDRTGYAWARQLLDRAASA